MPVDAVTPVFEFPAKTVRPLVIQLLAARNDASSEDVLPSCARLPAFAEINRGKKKSVIPVTIGRRGRSRLAYAKAASFCERHPCRQVQTAGLGCHAPARIERSNSSTQLGPARRAAWPSPRLRPDISATAFLGEGAILPQPHARSPWCLAAAHRHMFERDGASSRQRRITRRRYRPSYPKFVEAL